MTRSVAPRPHALPRYRSKRAPTTRTRRSGRPSGGNHRHIKRTRPHPPHSLSHRMDKKEERFTAPRPQAAANPRPPPPSKSILIAPVAGGGGGLLFKSRKTLMTYSATPWAAPVMEELRQYKVQSAQLLRLLAYPPTHPHWHGAWRGMVTIRNQSLCVTGAWVRLV